ncbi:ankyrin repeat domain-containing protein [Sphingobium sp. AN641]|uniref:ankyrin repeat domain-containing protein n=1 Tax=Sphingobium sp. AN641 TaxID=3133443 RepID=UPI0030BBBDC2
MIKNFTSVYRVEYSEGVNNVNLIAIAESGSLEGVSNALQEGCDVNMREPGTGITALHIAATKGFNDIVEILLSHPEIDLRIADHAGRIAYKAAEEAGNFDACNLIQNKLAEEFLDLDDSNVVRIVFKGPEPDGF